MLKHVGMYLFTYAIIPNKHWLLVQTHPQVLSKACEHSNHVTQQDQVCQNSNYSQHAINSQMAILTVYQMCELSDTLTLAFDLTFKNSFVLKPINIIDCQDLVMYDLYNLWLLMDHQSGGCFPSKFSISLNGEAAIEGVYLD